jgi:N-acetylglucosamine malate deacetylase 1
MKINILAFGVHPDDIELSCSGVLAAEKLNGKTTGIIDLTQGELGTRGTVETRFEEAQASAQILGVDVRENLKMADGFFENNEANKRLVITAIRKYQPDIVLCNAPEDRHPDHGRSAELLYEACFLSGLKKIETTDEHAVAQQAWRPKYLLNYIQDRYLQPDFVVDISHVMEKKLASIKAFKTQFHNPKEDRDNQTYISTPQFFEGLRHRSAMFGKMIGVEYAEGFISKKMIGLSSLDQLILKDT